MYYYLLTGEQLTGFLGEIYKITKPRGLSGFVITLDFFGKIGFRWIWIFTS